MKEYSTSIPAAKTGQKVIKINFHKTQWRNSNKKSLFAPAKRLMYGLETRILISFIM